MHRKQQVKVGKRVWIQQCLSYELSEELQNGMRALVIAIDEPSHNVTIETEDGQEWQLDPIHLDTGWHFQISGKLFAENTPRARAYIKSLIAQLRTEPPHPRFPELRDEKIAGLLVILQRNGCKPLALAA